MQQRRQQVMIKKWINSRWAGKIGEIRAWLDPEHALVDLQEPGYKATLKYHKNEFKEVQQ